MNEQILAFLKELQQNNNREWFLDNKSRFDVLKKGFIEEVQQLIEQIALFDPEITGVEAKDCIYRIYRDVRFSPDKTPYKNHFAAYIVQGGRRSSERAGYYMHIQPDGCFLSGGVWCPPPPLLKMLRKDIYDNMDEFLGILEEPSFKALFPDLEGETLKRMPAGYPADYEHDEILRHKDFCVVSYQPESFFTNDNWLEESVKCYKKLQPFNRFLNYTVDEYLGRV